MWGVKTENDVSIYLPLSELLRVRSIVSCCFIPKVSFEKSQKIDPPKPVINKHDIDNEDNKDDIDIEYISIEFIILIEQDGESSPHLIYAYNMK